MDVCVTNLPDIATTVLKFMWKHQSIMTICVIGGGLPVTFNLAAVLEAAILLLVVRLTLACYRIYRMKSTPPLRWALAGFTLLTLSRLVRIGYIMSLSVVSISASTHGTILLLRSVLSIGWVACLFYSIYSYGP